MTVIDRKTYYRRQSRSKLGADFRAARTETGLSQKALAELTEVPICTIRQWEQGHREPPAYIKKWYLKEVKKLVKKKNTKKTDGTFIMTVIDRKAYYERQSRSKLGADFRATRAETGLSIQELAELTEVPIYTIRRWEQGHREPPAYVKKWYLQEVKKIAGNKK